MDRIVQEISRKLPQMPKRLRVAAYGRVSSDKNSMLHSLAAQVEYYSRLIQEHRDWVYCGVYSDEGISGLNTRKREKFNQMIEDALAGKIDLIVTKSVSRFARNTVDSLITIRKLKEIGCECYFEKEGIYTFDSKGELLLTIMSSLAQEESRSISENVTWGQRKRFSDGKVSLGYSRFLGYTKGPDKEHPLVIVPEEAGIVRRIYSEFVSGKSTFTIAKRLTDDGIPTPGGKDKWRATTVESILSNEKYKGAALLQKTYTVDFLTKKLKKNEGEVKQYYIEHSHEAIIGENEWELVQMELRRRKQLGRRYSGNSVFGARLICGDCGAFFGTKTWNSTDKYRRVIWQCNEKFRNEKRCTTPHLEEDDIKARFLKAFISLFSLKGQLSEDCRLIKKRLTDTSSIESTITELLAEMEVVTGLMRRAIEENATVAQDQDSFNARYQEYENRYSALQSKIEKLQKQKEARHAQAKEISMFITEFEKRDEPITEFDDLLWLAAIDTVLVNHDGTLVFRFRNGEEVVG